MHLNQQKSIDLLSQQQIFFEILEHSKKVYTCTETALERQVPLTHVVKTLLCYDKKKQLHVFMLPGSENLNPKKARKVIGSNKLHFVPKATVENDFKLIIGAISPLLLLEKNGHFFIDKKLVEQSYLTISSGVPGSGIKLNTIDLLQIIPASVADIT